MMKQEVEHVMDQRAVRKRIQKRKNQSDHHQPLFFRLLYHTLMLAMACGICALAYLVNDKLGIINIPEAFSSWNLGKISEWLPFDGWFTTDKESDGEAVSALPVYSLLEGNKYANGGNQARLLMNGVVLHVEAKDAQQSSVTVRQDNGVIVTYGHLDQVQVKQDERVQTGDVLGSFQEYIQLTMIKNQQSVDYNTAIQP